MMCPMRDTQEAPTDSTGEPRAPSKKKTICRWPEKLQRQLCSPLSLHTTLIIISSRWARRSRAAQCKLAPFTPPTVLMPTVHNCPKIKHAWNSDTSVNMLASCCLRSYQSMYNHKEEVESKLQDSVSYYHALSFPWGYLYIWSTLSLFLVNITSVYLCSVMG